MKTRTSVLTGIIVITVALILIFISCDNGGADSYFIYDDHTYPLSAAYLGVVGPRNGAYSLSFNAFSSGIDVETEKGIGEAIFISIISPTSSLAEGTYTFAALISTTPFTFDILALLLNYNIETDWGDSYSAVDGTLTVTEVNGSTVSLEFEVTLDDGKTSTGTWSGPVTIY
jgi:hypothetical protein